MHQILNLSRSKFFKHIFLEPSKFLELGSFSIITGGDFNCSLSPKDARGGNYQQKYRTIAVIEDLNDSYDLVYIWHLRHPIDVNFTWRTYSPLIQRRLDYFLLSNELQPYIINTDILPGVSSDHSVILVEINNFPNEKHGPSYWRFNISLIDDSKYVETLRLKYEMWKRQIPSENSPVDKWDYLKYKIREFTTHYSKEKMRKFRAEL